MRRRSTKEEWAELLALKEDSTKSIKAFCEEFGVGVHQFYYWRKRLRGEAEGNTTTGTFVELDLKNAIGGDGSDSGLTLDLRELSLRFTRDFDEATLHRVLAIAASLRC